MPKSDLAKGDGAHKSGNTALNHFVIWAPCVSKISSNELMGHGYSRCRILFVSLVREAMPDDHWPSTAPEHPQTLMASASELPTTLQICRPKPQCGSVVLQYEGRGYGSWLVSGVSGGGKEQRLNNLGVYKWFRGAGSVARKPG